VEANNTINGIRAEYLSHFTDLPNPPGSPNYCTLHQWDTGIILYGSGNVVQNSAIEWSAGNGVALAGQSNTAKNNLIDHVDYMGVDTAGINLSGTMQQVQNNTIYATGRFGILINTWYYGSAVGLPNGTYEDIGYNNIFSAVMLSRDAGEIYTIQTTGVTGSTIHNNWLHDTQSLYPGPASNYPLPGVYLDNYSTGWVVDQNVLWNNQSYNIFLNGGYGTVVEPNAPPEDNSVYNNSIPDASGTAYILLADIVNCGTTTLTDNLVLVSLLQQNSTSPCPATNNSSAAAGATQMNSSVQVGCNFAGCSSEGPPTVSATSVAASIAVQPYNMTVAAGQPVTFSATGAGSPTLTYQWRRNGANITGATSASYTITAVSVADNEAIFTVTVTNSVGSATSNPATLNVQ
jgi:Ig-like domain-containing protein/parallel beta helix pectate lyase-like protein